MNCNYYKDYDGIGMKLGNLNNMLFSIFYFFYNNDDEGIVNALLTADFVAYNANSMFASLTYRFHFKEHKVTILLGSKYFSVLSDDDDLISAMSIPNTLPESEFWDKALKLENIIADYVQEKK